MTATLIRFNVTYETANFYNTMHVDAQNWEAASAKFVADWEEHGDKAPSHWCSGTWSIEVIK